MKRITALIVLFAALFSLASCGKKGSAENNPAGTTGVEAARSGAVTEDGFLTCIFRQTAFALDGGAQMLFDVVPYGDPETRSVTFSAITRERSEEGTWADEAGIVLYTCSAEGEVLEKTETALRPSPVATSGVVTADAVYLFYGTVQNNALLRWDRKTGDVTSTAEGEDFFGRPGFNAAFVTSDADGRIWCSDRAGVVVLNGDLSVYANFDLPVTVSSIARGGDGAVWALYRAGGGIHASRIDPETGGFAKEYTFFSNPAGSQGSRTLLDAALPMDCDFCLYDEDAVWDVSAGEDGMIREERVADFANSGIPSFSNLADFWNEKEGIFPAALVGPDLILAAAGSGGWEAKPSFWLRAPDVDPAGLKTIVLAHSTRLSPTVIEKIRTFSVLHPDARVEVHDYSVYNTDSDETAGEAQLMFDILNVGFRPDIVASRAIVSSFQRVSDRSLVPQMLKRSLIRDLTPWLEKDELVNFDNLFGCMHAFFDDGNGGIWGISPSMKVDVLVVSPAYLPFLGGKTKWTLVEMLDFFDALPEGAERFYTMSQKDALLDQLMLGGGYMTFFDENGHLDRELFRRYLAYLSGLPKDFQEWQRLNGSMVYPLPAVLNGDCGVCRSMCWNERFYAEDYRRIGAALIGYPVDRGSGLMVGTECAFSVTSFATDADLCFDLIRSFFTLDGIRQDMGYYPLSVPFFSLKSLYEDVQFACRADGSYYYTVPTEEELAWTYALLDEPVIPWLEQTPKEVGDICNEEISAFLGGLGTVEDCADKVESRVSIWLAERR